MLELRDIYTNYDHIRALKGISLTVREGEIVALIGANGAGKSTTLNTISGIVKAAKGAVLYNDKNITKSSTHSIVKGGIVQVPEGRAILTTLKVIENLELGAFIRKDSHQIKNDIESVFSRFPILEKRANQLAGTLSGGEQQMLAIGRALMAKPKILLLDEPSMGLAPLVVKGIFGIIREINREGTSILIVEQNARMALQISNRGYVLETGRIVLEDSSASLLTNKKVIEAYLGG
ncbi:MAG: ABC transporter ATP-binding protein [Desulfobacterales bacterium]|nr:ABC transporter ATP-binding protein [Desulfobacterales bacterium]